MARGSQPRSFSTSDLGLAPTTVTSAKTGRPIVIIDDRGVIDLRRLSRALGQVDKDLRKQLSQANKKAAAIISDETKRLMRSGGDNRYDGSPKLAQRAARTVRARASSRKVAVVIGVDGNTGNPPYANAVFWGRSTRQDETEGRSGWFGADEFSGYTGLDQGFAEWVGSSWGDLASGDGPYFLSPAVAAKRDEVMGMFRDGVQQVMAAAGFR